MPFVLRHRESGEIAACVQKNIYDLDYYGVKWWDTKETAQSEKQSFFEWAELIDLDQWELREVDESQVKRFNVRLRNNPALRLYWMDDGQVEVK